MPKTVSAQNNKIRTEGSAVLEPQLLTTRNRFAFREINGPTPVSHLQENALPSHLPVAQLSGPFVPTGRKEKGYQFCYANAMLSTKQAGAGKKISTGEEVDKREHRKRAARGASDGATAWEAGQQLLQMPRTMAAGSSSASVRCRPRTENREEQTTAQPSSRQHCSRELKAQAPTSGRVDGQNVAGQTHGALSPASKRREVPTGDRVEGP